MKENKLSIVINSPIEEVFNFTLDPNNTPEWIDGIKTEETNEWPAKAGTIYRNQNQKGVWRQYKLAELNENESFILTSVEGNFSVKYSFKKLDEDSTEFTYSEYVEKDSLIEPLTQDALEKLKSILEQ